MNEDILLAAYGSLHNAWIEYNRIHFARCMETISIDRFLYMMKPTDIVTLETHNG